MINHEEKKGNHMKGFKIKKTIKRIRIRIK
jgi:hypothetical protein